MQSITGWNYTALFFRFPAPENNGKTSAMDETRSNLMNEGKRQGMEIMAQSLFSF